MEFQNIKNLSMTLFNQENHPHRRYNPLLDEWILVSPHRARRPWQGQTEEMIKEIKPVYDEDCYLCPGNLRTSGDKNPNYKDCYVFENDFSALLKNEVVQDLESLNNQNEFIKIKPERGLNRVICFTPEHNLTLAEMQCSQIEKVIETWKCEYIQLGSFEFINYVQIFENKGGIMGCSNPHPHGQIWAQSSLPTLINKTQENLLKYYLKNNSSLLYDYLNYELFHKERVVIENEHFVVVVPFWAIWPYETMIISKRHFENITKLSDQEKKSLAKIIKLLTVKYDNLFNSSFPYSSGIHQSPTDGLLHPEWHFHIHFYPPLLRSSTVKKFMVGYELLCEAQRDITPEQSAKTLRELSNTHYKHKD
jgi:UDPglucose--hexose-1-phosphate uridylyltransferase